MDFSVQSEFEIIVPIPYVDNRIRAYFCIQCLVIQSSEDSNRHLLQAKFFQISLILNLKICSFSFFCCEN